MKVLADTSIIIDFLRQKDKKKSLFYFLASSNFDIYISIVTHTELFSGKSVWESKRAKRTLEELISGLSITPLSEHISMKAGRIRAKYNSSLFDAIVAATAVEEKLPLATLNPKDFTKISDLRLFRA